MTGDWQALLFGFLGSAAASAVFLLALIIGFCVLLGLPKLRSGGVHGRVVRTLDEWLDGTTQVLGPNTPRGPIDQLRATAPKDGTPDQHVA